MKIKDLIEGKKTYFLAFRLEHDERYDLRYRKLEDIINDVSGGNCWKDPTSFMIFSAKKTRRHIINKVKKCIDEDQDIVVIGKPGKSKMWIVGEIDDDSVFDLVNAKSV